jgi:hypothetical protein
VRPFAEVLHDWQVFYVTFATACATMVSLLFAAVSLNRDALSREESARQRWVARQTFYQFFMLFLLTLLLLAPHRTSTSVGLTLLAFGGFWSVGVVRAFLTSIRTDRQREDISSFLRGFGLSFASLLAVFAVAVGVLLGRVEALTWLVVVLVNLLLFTGRNAWSLLVHIRKWDAWQT